MWRTLWRSLWHLTILDKLNVLPCPTFNIVCHLIENAPPIFHHHYWYGWCTTYHLVIWMLIEIKHLWILSKFFLERKKCVLGFYKAACNLYPFHGKKNRWRVTCYLWYLGPFCFVRLIPPILSSDLIVTAFNFQLIQLMWETISIDKTMN